jgi:CBS domain-containing protein
LRPFRKKNNYRMKAREESIIYAIPIAVFRPFVANNAAVLNFLLETLQLISPVIKTMKTRGSLISDTVFYTDQQSEMQYFQIYLITIPH